MLKSGLARLERALGQFMIDVHTRETFIGRRADLPPNPFLSSAMQMLTGGAVLMRHGLDRLRVIEEEMVNWMREHEYESVEQLKGSLSHQHCADPSAFERAQYMRAVGVQKAL